MVIEENLSFVYDFSTKIWTSVSELQTPRNGHACGHIKGDTNKRSPNLLCVKS